MTIYLSLFFLRSRCFSCWWLDLAQTWYVINGVTSLHTPCFTRALGINYHVIQNSRPFSRKCFMHELTHLHVNWVWLELCAGSVNNPLNFKNEFWFLQWSLDNHLMKPNRSNINEGNPHPPLKKMIKKTKAINEITLKKPYNKPTYILIFFYFIINWLKKGWCQEYSHANNKCPR